MKYTRDEYLRFWNHLRAFMVQTKLASSTNAVDNHAFFRYLIEQGEIPEYSLEQFERLYDYFLMFVMILDFIVRTTFDSKYVFKSDRNPDNPVSWRFMNNDWILTKDGMKVLNLGDSEFLKRLDTYNTDISRIRELFNLK